MKYIPPKQTCMRNLVSISRHISATYVFRCIHTSKLYFFKVRKRATESKKKSNFQKNDCGTKYLQANKVLPMQNLALTDRKKSQHKQLGAYTLLNATFSKINIGIKIE